ncbi:hypothetical protein TH61_10800 [Rufibacter sp. DG15C]|uniref:hypothetical protein n=1 Tax=Rufibacter sp. DG15C TaxID=1379909 RepID=UPI00078C8856|nr:hypothetical protein [Rufibacter sp. DG15C]AMM51565.1 hypothetical protein TH61_10800 [Rufibacter sp. DG15C]
MTKKFSFYTTLLTVFLLSGNLVQAQDITHLPEVTGQPTVAVAKADSVQLPARAKMPKVSYSLSAGAAFSSFGSASYLEPRVQYHVTPRFSVFSSVMMIQAWGGATFGSTSREGGAATSFMNSPASRQYLVHVGGSYAMTEKLMLSGSVWKSIGPTSPARYMANPFMYGGYPEQGFNFQAKYQLAPNVTISGGVRYGTGQSGYFGGPSSFYNNGSAFGNPF